MNVNSEFRHDPECYLRTEGGQPCTCPRPTPIDNLRRVVARHREWPTQETSAEVVYAAEQLISTIDQHAAMIEHMRAHVTPTEEAIRAVLGGG